MRPSKVCRLLLLLLPLLAGGSISVGSMGGYPILSEVSTFLASACRDLGTACRYPVPLGRSLENRAITAICVGRCGESETSVPAALYTGLHHAREPMSLMAVLYFIDDLRNKYLAGDEEVTALLQLRQICE